MARPTPQEQLQKWQDQWGQQEPFWSSANVDVPSNQQFIKRDNYYRQLSQNLVTKNKGAKKKQMTQQDTSQDPAWIRGINQMEYYNEELISDPPAPGLSDDLMVEEDLDSSDELPELELLDIESGKYFIMVKGSIRASTSSLNEIKEIISLLLSEDNVLLPTKLEDISVFQRLKIQTGVFITHE